MSCKPNRLIPRGWREVSAIFILKARLILHLRSNIGANMISYGQHAYLKGKSVESSLHDMVGGLY